MIFYFSGSKVRRNFDPIGPGQKLTQVHLTYYAQSGPSQIVAVIGYAVESVACIAFEICHM